MACFLRKNSSRSIYQKAAAYTYFLILYTAGQEQKNSWEICHSFHRSSTNKDDQSRQSISKKTLRNSKPQFIFFTLSPQMFHGQRQVTSVLSTANPKQPSLYHCVGFQDNYCVLLGSFSLKSSSQVAPRPIMEKKIRLQRVTA